MTRTFEQQLAADTIEAIKTEAKRTGLPSKKIHRHSGADKRLRNARCRVAKALHKQGYEFWHIGRALGVDVDTVRFLIKGERAHQQRREPA